MIQSYLNNEEEAAARGANLDLNLGVGVPVHRSINSEGSSSNFSDDIIKKHKPIKSSKSHDEQMQLLKEQQNIGDAIAGVSPSNKGKSHQNS